MLPDLAAELRLLFAHTPGNRNLEESMEEKVYRFWLHNLPGVGDRTIERLLGIFGSPREICRASFRRLAQTVGEKTAIKVTEFNKIFDAGRAYDKMLSEHIAFYTREDDEYPSRLSELSCPPYGLYCLGSLPPDETPAAALIGAREHSEYGGYMARAFAGKLAEAGVSVISGMARGIDGLGQMAALERGGRTYAVLGCGVDICYPASNRDLYRQIASKGGILSVFPPGTAPARGLFPERNRIVAALSDLVLVVEARLKSGTLITVDRALEQGKSVYAVPGRLTDRLSDGCNLLIRQGAGIALAPEDLLAELNLLENRKGKRKAGGETGGNEEAPAEEGILEFLDFYPKSVQEILGSMEEAGLKVEFSQVLKELMDLCLQGRARQIAGTYFAKTGGGEDDFQGISNFA